MNPQTVLYVPLDERPCNISYPDMIFHSIADWSLLTAPRELMGFKKSSANVESIFQWIEDRAPNAQALVVSVETLLYGGLLPSRIHHLKSEITDARFWRLLDIRRQNPHLRLYAFALIMRSPAYDSADEEPDYYENHGASLYLLGGYLHRKTMGILTHDEGEELKHLESLVPKDVVEDYLGRRRFNLRYTSLLLEAVALGDVDYLTIPQDDTAEYGFPSLERRELLKKAASLGVDHLIPNYPGADEAGCSLTARAWIEAAGQRPKVLPIYSHQRGLDVIPQYEDRPLRQTIERHIEVAGLETVEKVSHADAVIAFNLPIEKTYEATSGLRVEEMTNPPDSVRDLVSMLLDLPANTRLYVVDIRFTNGADLSLLSFMDRKGILGRMAFYSGWNTCGNSIGTACAAAALGESDRDVLKKRLFEDAGYMAWARKLLHDEEFPSILDSRPTAEKRREELGAMVTESVEAMFRREFPNSSWLHEFSYKVSFPWSRQFEIDIRD